jgi:hypothetical protein
MLNDAIVDQLRPGVYRRLSREANKTLYIKVHDAWARTIRGEPLFPAEITAGVIYILRNPLDIAASCAHHWGVDLGQAVENLCDPAFTMARSRDGLADQLRQKIGSWTGHARSWLDQSRLPVQLVRYEDLCRNPEAAFREVVRFCGLPEEASRLKKAVAFSDFSELQRQEQCHGFCERPLRASGRFFRRGQAGAWCDELSPALAGRLIRTHGKFMRRFLYLDENDQAVGARLAALSPRL